MNLRMERVQAPIIPIVGELIKNNPGTISLGQGVAFYGPPQSAIDQLTHFLSNPENHKYKLVNGIRPLYEGLCDKLKRENGIEVCREAKVSGEYKLCVTAGGNMAFMNAVLAIADAGDEIILLTPFYFNHEMAVHIADCDPVAVPTDEHYQPDLDAIRNAITDKTRAVLTVSPNNPTGAVYPEETLRAINQLCKEHGIYHINDEAYEYFTYDAAKHFSPGSIKGAEEHTISLYSFSKAYGFASWRIGYMVYPAELDVSIKKIQDTILICPPVISQYAAYGALQSGADYCRGYQKDITAVREVTLNELGQLNDICTLIKTNGAFYFLLKINAELDEMELIKRLVEEYGVAVIPGCSFGMKTGCYLRISYGALQKDTAIEGVNRLARGLKGILGA